MSVPPIPTPRITLPQGTLKACRDIIHTHTRFNTQDLHAVEVCLSAVVANLWRFDTVRIWVQLAGAPSTGKTLILETFRNYRVTHFVDTLTPQALASAYNLQEGEDHSLLPQIDRKILIIKDFSTIIGLPAAQSSQILGDLRACYDQEFKRHTGVGGRSYADISFGILAACTPVLYDWLQLHSELGERFIITRVGADEAAQPYSMKREKQAWIWDHAGQKKEWGAEIQSTVQAHLSSLLRVLQKNSAEFYEASSPPAVKGDLLDLSAFAAQFRTNPGTTTVSDPEGATRLMKQLQRLCSARAVLDGRTAMDETDVRFAARLCRDSIHPQLLSAVSLLWGGSPGRARTGVQKDTLILRTGLDPWKTASVLRHWCAWNLIRPHQSGPDRYCFTDDVIDRIDSCRFFH